MKKIISFLLIILLLPFPVKPYAADDVGYIVKIKEKRHSRRYLLPDGIEELGREKGVYFTKNKKDIEKLESLGAIEYIEPNYTVTLFSVPGDEYYADQTNMHIINVENAWDIGCYGNEVRIGVIDTGVYNHPDLIGNILPGYNYYNDNEDTTDTHGHGTLVSGLIASRRNNIGIVGAAYKAKIVPLKCFGNGVDTTLKTIVDSIYGAVDDFDCQIINMSLGMQTNTVSLSEAVDYAVSKNVIIVAAVGNDGGNKLNYPAAYDKVIGVGSVDDDKAVSSFSQRNGSVFITAPGNEVLSLGINDGYRRTKGTSFSTPLVAGAIAIAKCADDSLDADGIMDLLAASSEDLGEPGYDVNYGYGLLNVQALLDRLLEDKNWFVSPIDKEEGDCSVYILNNSDKSGAAVSIFAGFTDNRLIDAHVNDIILPAKKGVFITFGYTGDTVKHFLWSDSVYMKPLFKSRQTN